MVRLEGPTSSREIAKGVRHEGTNPSRSLRTAHGQRRRIIAFDVQTDCSPAFYGLYVRPLDSTDSFVTSIIVSSSWASRPPTRSFLLLACWGLARSRGRVVSIGFTDVFKGILAAHLLLRIPTAVYSFPDLEAGAPTKTSDPQQRMSELPPLGLDAGSYFKK